MKSIFYVYPDSTHYFVISPPPIIFWVWTQHMEIVHPLFDGSLQLSHYFSKRFQRFFYT